MSMEETSSLFGTDKELLSHGMRKHVDLLDICYDSINRVNQLADVYLIRATGAPVSSILSTF